MKQRILFFSIIIVFVITCCKKQNSLVSEDLLYLKKLIENAYICYDEVNTISPIKFDIKKMENKYKRNSLYRKIRGFDDFYINGINQDAFVNLIGNFLWNCHFDDGHLKIQTEKDIMWIYSKESLYISEYLFIKKDDDFFLFSSPNENLIGKKYTGDKNNLKRTIFNKQEFYIFAPSLFEYADNYLLNLDEKNYKIPIKFYNPLSEDKSILKIKETNLSLYIKSSTFNIIKDSEEYDLFMKNVAKITESIKDKNFIILDLRGNHGGYIYYPRLLTTAISGMYENEEQRNEFFKFLDNGQRGKLILNSLIIAKTEYENVMKKNQSSEIIEFTKQEYENQQIKNQRFYIGANELLLDYLPQFNSFDKKIIILTDYYTASSAELFIGFCYMLNKENVIIVGGNTAGSLRNTGILKYELPNSKVIISFAKATDKNTPLLKYVPNWHGENCGFGPDYWTNDNNLVETLVYLTGDRKIENLFN